MFTKAGVVAAEADPQANAPIVLVVQQGQGPKNLGYNQFVSQFGFDHEGNLLWVGAWE